MIAACGGGSTAPPDASLRPKYGDGILTPRGGTITGVAAGTGLSGGGTAGSVTLNVANTAVAAGSYSNSTITVNAQGQVTAASNGAAPVTSGGLGTNTDLAIFTGTNAVGNYGGSSPSACTAGNAVIRAIMSPSGALTLTCGSAGITNSAGANVLMKSDGTNAVASSVSDNGTTVSTAENLAITGVGTLAVAALSTLTGGFTLGADSSAGSHKITSLANGVSSSDAAAFGQIASGVSAAVTGTTNTIAMFTGTNAVGNGPLTVSGSTVTDTDTVTSQPVVKLTDSTYSSESHGAVVMASNVASRAALSLATGMSVFNTTEDPILSVGYNTDGRGGQTQAAENQLMWNIEADYNDGIRHNMEIYWQYESPDELTIIRPIFYQFNRATNAITGAYLSAPAVGLNIVDSTDTQTWETFASSDITVGAQTGADSYVEVHAPTAHAGHLLLGQGGVNNIFDMFPASAHTTEMNVEGNAIMFLYDTPTGAAGAAAAIGTNDNSAVLTLQNVGADAVKGLVVRAKATQAGDLVEVQNSASTPLVTVSPTGLLTCSAGLTSTAGTTSLGVTNESGVFTLSNQEVFGAAGAVSYAGLTNTGVLAYDTTGHNLVLAAQETTGTSHVQLATSNSSAATVMVDVGTVGGDITLGASGATGTVSVRSGLGGGGEFRLCDSACATFWTLGRENTSTGDFQLNGTNAHIIDVAPAAVSDSLVIGTTGSTVTGTLAVTGAITGSSTLRATTILSETQLNDHTRGTEFMDDFWTTPKSDTRWTASTGVIDLANVDANHPGIFDAKTLPSGTGLGNATAWVQAGTAAGAGNGWFAGGGITDAAWEFEPSTAPSGTNHRFVAGLIDTVGTSTPNNGIYCLGDGTNTHIQVCTAKASTRTCTATLVTMTAVHWYRCQFEVNAAGTSVLFTVTDITGAASDTKTNTTNIPNTSANVCSPGIGDIRESTTGSGDLAVDYAWFKQTFTTAR